MTNFKNSKSTPTKRTSTKSLYDYGNVPDEDDYGDGDIPQIDLPQKSAESDSYESDVDTSDY